MFSDMHLKRCLMNEIRVMKQLDSPYIVKFLDVFETSNNYYIVQEYC
jgi:serine/threonine protein kinase